MLVLMSKTSTPSSHAAAKPAARDRRRAPELRPRSGPQRTCSGCRQVVPQQELLRLALGPAGEVVPDLGRRLPGRGAWIHPRLACVQGAVARGLARSLRVPVRVTLDELLAALRMAADHRIAGLLSSARRAGVAAIGASPVKQALASGAARFVVVARDARAALGTPGVEEAISTGHAMGWGDKVAIGQAVGKSEVAVLAVLDDGLAEALSTMIHVAHLGESRSEVDRAGGYPFREV